MSLRERSLCEPPEGPVARPEWCGYPHEVRAFPDRRDACDHCRGEPWPEADDAPMRERREELAEAMHKHCTGTDRALTALREKHRVFSGSESAQRKLSFPPNPSLA